MNRRKKRVTIIPKELIIKSTCKNSSKYIYLSKVSKLFLNLSQTVWVMKLLNKAPSEKWKRSNKLKRNDLGKKYIYIHIFFRLKAEILRKRLNITLFPADPPQFATLRIIYLFYLPSLSSFFTFRKRTLLKWKLRATCQQG